jgi:uncharacterized membrane protein HdeD (DUF308 family)
MSMPLKKERLYDGQKEEQTGYHVLERWVVSARENAGWLIALGVLEVVLGVMAIGAPLIAGIAASMFVGALLLVAGIARVIRVSKAQSFGQGSLAFFAGLLGIGCGLLILAQPLLGLGSLTLLLAAYFMAEGISCLFLSFKIKPHGGWGWLLCDGIITSCLAFLIAAEWPLSGVWALGTLLGIDILITGMAAISIGWAARGAAHYR